MGAKRPKRLPGKEDEYAFVLRKHACSDRYRLAQPQRPYHQIKDAGRIPFIPVFLIHPPPPDHVLRDGAAVELGVAIMTKSSVFDPYHSRVRVTRVLRDRTSPFEVSVDNTLACAIQLGCMLPCVSCASYGQVETAVRWLVDGTKRIMCARSSFRHPSGSTHPPASLVAFCLPRSDALCQRMIRTPYPSSSGCGRLTGCVASSERCSKKRERKQSNTPPLSAASAHRPLTLRHMHPFTDRICPLIRSPRHPRHGPSCTERLHVPNTTTAPAKNGTFRHMCAGRRGGGPLLPKRWAQLER